MAMILRFVAVALLLMLLTSCEDSGVKDLIEAARYGDVDRMTRLIDGGANVDGIALDGWTPLTRAAAGGQLKAVKLLVARGADIKGTGNTVTPLHWAFFNGHLEIAKYLVQSGAQLRT